jgi:hypothetical protein
MARRRDENRVPKSLQGKLRDLDDQLYLLRLNLHKLREDPSHLKAISGGLRTLVCIASRTEGLLWRLVDELGVSDAVHLQLAGSVDPTHPLAQGLSFSIVQIARAGDGDPRLAPAFYSLRVVIKEAEAVYVGGISLTHERLILELSQQMGLAHEDDGISQELAQLGQILLNGVQPYYRVLAMDAELTLEVGERVLDESERRGLYRRRARGEAVGEVSLLCRCRLKRTLDEPIEVLSTHSPIADFRLSWIFRSGALAFVMTKRGERLGELAAPFPPEWFPGTNGVFAWSYSSNERKARIVTGHAGAGIAIDCNLGWLSAAEFVPPTLEDGIRDLIEFDFIFPYMRLLSAEDCRRAVDLSPDLSELFLREGDCPDTGPFPD